MKSLIKSAGYFIVFTALIVLNSCETPEPYSAFDPNMYSHNPNTEVYFYNNSRDAESYLWDFGDGQTSIDSSPSHLYLDTGLFNPTLTVTATNGCQLQSSTLISISNSPSIDYSILSSICQFEPIEFQSYITTEDSVALVSWHLVDSTYFGQNIGVLLDTFGSIDCILEVVVGTDCKVDSSFSILVNEAPIASFIIEDSCLNNQIIARDNSFVPFSQSIVFSQWSFNGFTFINIDSIELESVVDSSYSIEYQI